MSSKSFVLVLKYAFALPKTKSKEQNSQIFERLREREVELNLTLKIGLLTANKDSVSGLNGSSSSLCCTSAAEAVCYDD